MNGGHLRNAVLAAADAVALVVAWALALWGYWAVGIGHYKFGWEFYLKFTPAIAAFLLANAALRLYHGNPLSPSVPVSPPEEMRRLTLSSLLVHVGVIAALALAFQTTRHHSRAVILIAGLLTAVLAQPLRNLARRMLQRLSVGQIAVSVFGEGAQVERLRRFFAYDAYLGFRPAAPGERTGIAVVCGTGAEGISELLSSYAHVICFPGGLFPPVGGALTVSVNGLGGIAFDNHRRMWLPRLVKRLMDVLLGAFALVVLSPVLLLAALLVKVTGRGPVFQRRQMFGLDGKPFRLWGFRTAATPAGRFLGRTSLSVLPRLLNVLAGDMSLVGPSPVTERERARYGSAYAAIASVRPGITGLWRAAGCRSDDYERRAALDEYYALNWSPWMDLWILMSTVGAVFLLNDVAGLKLVVAAHKRYRMPSGSAYVPLQVGAAGRLPIGFLRDDTGENISARNANWCELTGLYWAWKNLDAKAIGLVHYRRLFKTTPQAIAVALETHDVVLPQPRHYVIETNYSQYVHAHHAVDLDLTRTIIGERCADYLPAFDAVMRRTGGHRFNMFVMRREVLDRYCTWLFDILFELERRLDISSYSPNDARVFGFVSERLLDVWIECNAVSFAEFPVRHLESQHWPRKIVAFLRRKFGLMPG